MFKIDIMKTINDVSKAAKQATDDVVNTIKETDYKAIADDLSKKAGKAFDDTAAAFKNFDVKETMKAGGDLIGDMADTIRNTKPEDIPKGIADMAKKGGDAVVKFANDAMQTTKDANKVLSKAKKQEEVNVSIKAALQVIYLLMAIDNDISQEELDLFKEICKDTKLDPSDYEGIVKACNNIIRNAKADGDYYDVISENVMDILRQDKQSDQSIGKRMLLWNLLTIAKCDGTYTQEEQRILRTIARTLAIDKAIIYEMEFAYDTVNALRNVDIDDGEYQKEVNERKETIMQSIYQLIDDKEV